MVFSRRLMLGSLACAAWARPRRASAEAPIAVSSAPARFWPVVTDHPKALDIAAALSDGRIAGSAPLRRFNAPRPAARADNPTRRHVGVDLFAYPGDAVVAVEDGRVIAFYPFLRAAAGAMSYALIVAHAGYVANYGEVKRGSLTACALAPGDSVAGGRQIAAVSDTSQLHFETYAAGVTHNASWPQGAPRPAGVLDPTALLLDLAANGRRLRPAHRQASAAGE
jgi:murein DD-endopeptidase MepM/ murein hydrolase activator NlpD